MKINFIIPSAKLSGGIRMVFLYANALVERGHDVVCYYPLLGSYRGWKKILFLKSILGHTLNSDWRGKWFHEMKFKIVTPFIINNRTVRDADITIATFWLTAYWVQKLNKGKRVYFIQGYEDWEEHHSKVNGKNSYKLKFDLAITISNALKQKLWDEVKLESIVVCNGIPREEIGRAKKTTAHCHVYIGFPYRDEKNKNCNTAINVLKRISDTEQLIIIAYGRKKPLDWPDKWHFLENPNRKQLFDFYDKTDIFYVPSEYEGWGLPAMEAMGHGVAVLAGNSGIIAEMGIDDVNCKILKDPLDSDEAVSKIMELIYDAPKRRAIGHCAYKIIRDNYTIENACDDFEKALLSILVSK